MFTNINVVPDSRAHPGAVLSFLLPILMLAASAAAQVSLTSARVRALNNDLLGVHGEMQRATPNEAALLRGRAATIIEQRAAALKALIEQEPRQALSLAFSPDLLADLAAKFPESASRLEIHGTWQGPVEHWIIDYADLKTHRSVYRMKVGRESIEVYFAATEPGALKSGDLLQASGVLVGNAMAVSTATIQAPAEAAATCGTNGVQNTAVLLVTFPDATVPSNITPQSVYDMFFSATGQSLAGYWREASYGRMSVTGDVFGTYTLDSSYNNCMRMDLLRDAAITAAGNAGVNFQNYSRLFIVTPDMCGWTGMAMNGCSSLSSPSGPFIASAAFLNGRWQRSQTEGAQNAAHEGGHNLGLAHAQTRDFGMEALGALAAPGTITDYGDRFSVMAVLNFGHYAAPHKAQILNWLSSSNYQVVQSNGTWTLKPFSANTTGLQALKIQRGSGNDAWLWVEYRQPIGDYDSTLSTQPFSGALIHYQDSTSGFYTQLLDFTPETDSWYDPALVAGHTWVDSYTNLSIATQSATSEGLTVNVSYGTTPCTRANPAVTMSPLNPSASPGADVNYTVSVTNNDAAACTASTFNLRSSEPSGWPTAFSAASLVLDPGQTSSVTMTKTVPASATPATYQVNAAAANGAFAGSATANCTVVAPPSLSASLSLSSSGSTAVTAYTARQTVSMTATVLNAGAPVAGASVTFTMTKADGSKSTKKGTTDSTGSVIWSYRVANRDPKGTYSAVASASYNSQSATSNLVTFTVQ